MASFNKVVIAGNLARDPELKYTPKGTAICAFTVCVNREYSGDDGAKKKEACFVDIEAWGRQAEIVAQYFKKGLPILVEGRLKQDNWEDKATKQKRSKLKVVLESFSFLGDKQQRTAGENKEPESAEANAKPAAPSEGEDSDVPF